MDGGQAGASPVAGGCWPAGTDVRRQRPRVGPWAARERSRQARARLGCAVASFNDHSVIVVPERSDPLVTFTRDRLDEPPRNAGTPVVYLLPPNTFPGLTWDQTLAEVVAQARTAGGRVWVPGYVVDSLPPRWSGWVEGGQSVSWRQVRQTLPRFPCGRRAPTQPSSRW